MADPIDPSDPCAAAAALRVVYYSLLSGKQVESVEFAAGNGSSRRVTYSRVNLSELRAEIARLDNACSTSSGKAKRFGLRAGGMF